MDNLWIIYRYLVGGWSLPLWKKWKSIGMIIPNLWEDKKCSKPPTRWHILTCDFALHSELCSPANKVIVFPFWVIILSMTQAQQVSKSVNHQNVHDFAFFKHWWHQFQLPSGKQPQTYGTSTFFYREKNTTRLFPIAMLNHQGVALHTHHPSVFPKLIYGIPSRHHGCFKQSHGHPRLWDDNWGYPPWSRKAPYC